MKQTSSEEGCDVLVAIAHPDDEVFTSGVICLCVDKGLTVKIVCFTDGEGGEIAQVAAATPEALAQIRIKELAASANALGVKSVHRLRQSDVPNPKASGGWRLDALIDDLGRLIRQERPSTILTHGPMGGYGHEAHKVVYECVIGAVEKTAFSGAVYSFSGAVPGAFFSWRLDQPSDLVFDVTQAFTRRCGSLSYHQSQIDYFLQPYPPKTFRKHISAFAGHLLSTSSFGRKKSRLVQWRGFSRDFRRKVS